jgi:hypothetical protein
MELFVQATDHEINMHAKIQYLILHRFLQTIILVSEFLEFCTIKYCSNVRLIKLASWSCSRGVKQYYADRRREGAGPGPREQCRF